MIHHHTQQRRTFLRLSLGTIGAVACPWVLHPALAASPGRAPIGFQGLPLWMRFIGVVLTAMRGIDEPDLGDQAIVVPAARQRKRWRR